MGKYVRRKNEESCDVYVNNFEWTSDHTGIIIQWESPQLGWGEYVLKFDVDEQKLYIDSEHMDREDDLRFLKALLEAIPKTIF